MRVQDNQKKLDEYREKAKELVSQLTLEAKVAQMVFRAPAIPELKIKAYTWWNEALHGVARAGTATVFPQAIALAASFDTQLVREVADATATEGRAKYIASQKYGDTDAYKGLTYWAPNVNIFRDPRWGRGHETYGEDPYLTSRMGVSYIEGLQGDDENHLKAAACAKHFAVHSGPEDMRHYFDAQVSEQDLYETYLPAFEACVKEAKVEAIMGAYNRTNGEPCCGSKRLLKDILRGDWKFDGHVVSDCWAIQDFHMHHQVTKDGEESAALAVKNGCEMNCGEMFYNLLKAVEKGMVSEQDIDAAVVDLFTARLKLGTLLEGESTVYDNIPYSVIDSKQMQELSLKAAEESTILLKNENQLLPLDIDKVKTIAVIGPNANNRRALVGNYEGTSSRYVTPLEGIQDFVGDRVRVLYAEACHLFREKCGDVTGENDRLSELRAVIDESDVVIACMGLDSGLEGEEGDQGNAYASGDKKTLDLPGKQMDVLQILAQASKPVVLVDICGSSVTFGGYEKQIPALIQMLYPGQRGGEALARILFGEVSPSGKLPVTFYKDTKQLPEFTDYAMKGRTYRYFEGDVLYPFGYGLTYADVKLCETHVVGAEQKTSCTEQQLREKGLQITYKLANASDIAAKEVVQAYIRPVKDTLEGQDAQSLPNLSLKWFNKVALAAQETKEGTITLSADAFAYCDATGAKVLRKGNYDICIGFSSKDAIENPANHIRCDIV